VRAQIPARLHALASRKKGKATWDEVVAKALMSLFGDEKKGATT
jgi:hypothetical protein